MHKSPLLLAVLTGLALGCAHAPAPAPASAPAPVIVKAVATPDARTTLPGHWAFVATLSGEEYSGTLDFTSDAQGWHARMVEARIGETAASSVVVTGQEVVIQLTADGEPVTVTATLQPDGTLAGKVVTGEAEGTFGAKKG